jgi:hypothetical protein
VLSKDPVSIDGRMINGCGTVDGMRSDQNYSTQEKTCPSTHLPEMQHDMTRPATKLVLLQSESDRLITRVTEAILYSASVYVSLRNNISKYK